MQDSCEGFHLFFIHSICLCIALSCATFVISHNVTDPLTPGSVPYALFPLGFISLSFLSVQSVGGGFSLNPHRQHQNVNAVIWSSSLYRPSCLVNTWICFDRARYHWLLFQWSRFWQPRTPHTNCACNHHKQLGVSDVFPAKTLWRSSQVLGFF